MTEKNDKEPTVHDQTDIEVPTMEASNEEKSAFFEQWKAKHQAYLASQEREVESVESPPQLQEQKKLFQGIKKPRKQAPVSNSYSDRKLTIDFAIPKVVLWKSVPILLTSLLLAALSLYFISPTSRAKEIAVKGQDKLTADQVINYSLISDKDYIVTTLLNASAYAENVKKNSPSVESSEISYQFPNKFTIRIKEYAIIGYIQQNNQVYPVLSSGNIGTEVAAADTLPETYTTIQLSDKNQVKQLAVALGGIDRAIREKIQTVSLTPSQVTADLLTLNMTDGNTVLVPLSELAEKLPYYAKIAAEVSGPTTVDMEVGIYRYSSES
ncbi:TPA: cell division protein FtsQ/DivIB [Streptococcus suis]